MRFLFFSILFLLLPLAPAQATSVLQMNLADMTGQAEKIFRGTLIDVRKAKVAVGGGEVPAVVYIFNVKEVFKGEVTTVKGRQVAEIKMVGTVKMQQAGRKVLPGFPLLATGGEYLLMVAPAGPTGLTATMGLGQGAFRVFYQGKTEVAVNDFNNTGLFADTGRPSTRAAAHAEPAMEKGAIPYTDLAAQIHTLLGN